MVSTTTLGDLKAQALDYADLAGSSFPDSSLLNNYINNGLSEIYDILVNAYEDYFHKVASISIIAGQEDYDLPSDHYKTQKVFHVSGSTRTNVNRYTVDEVQSFTTGSISGGAIELWYVPQMTKLELDTTTISMPIASGWEDFVSLYAAIRLLMKKRADPSHLVSERERIRERITVMAEPRDEGEPESVSDHYGRWSSSSRQHPGGSTYRYRIMGNIIKLAEAHWLGV